MPQDIAQFSAVVRDYEEALSFYVDKFGFDRLDDTALRAANAGSACVRRDRQVRAFCSHGPSRTPGPLEAYRRH